MPAPSRAAASVPRSRPAPLQVPEEQLLPAPATRWRPSTPRRGLLPCSSPRTRSPRIDAEEARSAGQRAGEATQPAASSPARKSCTTEGSRAGGRGGGGAGDARQEEGAEVVGVVRLDGDGRARMPSRREATQFYIASVLERKLPLGYACSVGGDA